MREQGVAANATRRVVRGLNQGGTEDTVFRTRLQGRASVVADSVLRAAAGGPSRVVSDVGKDKLLKTRESVVAYWRETAELLDAQGEIELAGDVRYFARRLPMHVDKKHSPAKIKSREVDEPSR
jgi:hypothetical protein